MTAKTIKRNSNTGIDQRTGGGPCHGGVSQGVGGRHKGEGPPVGGGEYLDVCAKTADPLKGPKKFARDPRLNELREMGLAGHWVDIAESIGVDNFVTVWQILDQADHIEDVGSGLRVWVPRYKLFLRYQRNRLIQSLAQSGESVKKIRAIIKKNINESLTSRHIGRIIAAGKVKR